MLFCVIPVILVLVVVVLVLLNNKAKMNAPKEEDAVDEIPEEGTTVLTNRMTKLMSEAESKQNAKEIADVYDITFISYSDGIATYYTEEDPDVVIQRGKDRGYPLLVVDHEMKMFN